MKRVLFLLIFVAVLGSPWILPDRKLQACSLCTPGLKNQDTLGSQFERAKIVLSGWISDPQFDTRTGAVPGAGTTTLHIEKILKYHKFLGDKKTIVLNRYLPVLDPKSPPRYLVFCDVFEGKLDPYLGRPIESNLIVAYLEQALKHREQGRIRALQYYFQFLDHPNEDIAKDAFIEFSKSSDKEVCEVAEHLSAEKIRVLMRNPTTNPDFIGLLAFLLGRTGLNGDMKTLESFLIRDDAVGRKARDGVLSGMVALNPREGWATIRGVVSDPKQQFANRFAAVQAVRFCYGWKPVEFRQQTLSCLQPMVADGDVADLAIEDLRKWEIWDLTPNVLAQFGKKSHSAPITQRAIVRYALTCPLPTAQLFVDEIRPRHAELVKEIEEGLRFQKGD